MLMSISGGGSVGGHVMESSSTATRNSLAAPWPSFVVLVASSAVFGWPSPLPLRVLWREQTLLSKSGVPHMSVVATSVLLRVRLGLHERKNESVSYTTIVVWCSRKANYMYTSFCHTEKSTMSWTHTVLVIFQVWLGLYSYMMPQMTDVVQAGHTPGNIVASNCCRQQCCQWLDFLSLHKQLLLQQHTTVQLLSYTRQLCCR